MWVFDLLGESERSGEGRILREGVNAAGMAFEILAPLDSQFRMARLHLCLFRRPLAAHCIVSEFDDVENDGKSSEQVRELG